FGETWNVKLMIRFLAPIGEGAEVTTSTSSIAVRRGDSCFARYDYDTQHGCHLNILQKSPFEDRIHYEAVGLAGPWNWVKVLEYVLDTLVREIEDRVQKI
ncbi:MAG: hypothetical protein ACRD6W_03625, partial [Nitrososphaerales archaeon]